MRLVKVLFWTKEITQKCVCVCVSEMYAYLSSHTDFHHTALISRPSVYVCLSVWQRATVCSNVCVCVCPHGPNQVSDTFCFGSSLMDEIFICAIDQEGAGPKLSV